MNSKRSLLRVTALSATLAMAVALHAATPAQNQKYLTRLYQDLLNRTPNRAELSLGGLVLSLGAPRTQIAGAITSGNEYRSEQIQLWSAAYLNRPATSGELAFYLNLLQNGATDDDVRAILLGSDEFYRLAGGTAPGIVNRLFQDVLGRSPDRFTVAAFENLLTQGTPRQTVALMVLHSLECDQRQVTQWFAKFLSRAPQTAELTAYVQMLQLGAKEEMVVDLITGGDEYFQVANS